MKKYLLLLIGILQGLSLLEIKAQSLGAIEGKVFFMGNPLEGVSLSLPALGKGCLSDTAGIFRLSAIPPGKYVLKASLFGFKASEKEIEVAVSANSVVNFELEEDILHLNAVVITGSRLEESLQKSLIPISSISRRTFDVTQALNLAEGLNFSPGLRLENNCQNCGFTQLRMLGLGGAYSQILINSRPIFSALAGVYGLEMLPANMIERIEVIRGGGSVMYGPAAIAGTINVITREPSTNSFEVGYNQAFTQFQIPDRTMNLNGSWVSPELNKGVHLYAYTRDRHPFDANGDGFSEIPILKNTTLGLDAFWNTPRNGKLKIGGFYIQEFRRGGNRFEYAPHQADIAEQLNHNLLGSHVSYEKFSANLKHKWTLYASGQWIQRNSYYGGGGRLLNPGDSLLKSDVLALNAYGYTQDVTTVTGLQYFYDPNQRIRLLFGGEYQYNQVEDQMPGYARSIKQNVGALGVFTQLQYRPHEKLTLAAGGRLDILNLKGIYNFGALNFNSSLSLIVPVPKLSIMYDLTKQIKIRGTFAQGYRAPQAFNEDLHIEAVGGAARFTQLAPNLKPERSNSFFTSVQFNKPIGKINFSYLVEGFYTHLDHPFILSAPVELPNGISVIEKRNGGAAVVQGLNTEWNAAFTRKWLLQLGATLQKAEYAEKELIWEPENGENSEYPAVFTTHLLRTPNVYGFFSLVYTPIEPLNISVSGAYTGPMDVPHVIDPETEYTVLKRTPSFFEVHLKINYQFSIGKNQRLELSGGIQNIFNSYQQDFDRGALRDAGYVYGPARPRTLFFGIKWGLNPPKVN